MWYAQSQITNLGSDAFATAIVDSMFFWIKNRLDKFLFNKTVVKRKKNIPENKSIL